MAGGVQYLALLRGVNVGGKNLVKMADLRDACEAMELADVATYIQSGNVLFRAPRQKRDALAARLEAELTKRFGIELKVVLLTHAQLASVVDDAPRGFGGAEQLCDVIFIRRPLTARKAFAKLDPRDGVDRAWQGRGVVYFSRVAEEARRSRMSKIVGTVEYKSMTIRSWRTTTKLLDLMESRSRKEGHG